MTEIALYAADVPSDTDPRVTPPAGLFDLNPSMGDEPNNTVAFDVALDGDEVTAIRYIGTEGNVLGTLDPADYTAVEGPDATTYTLAPGFLSGVVAGTSGLSFEFASGQSRRVVLEVVDTTVLEGTVAEAAALTPNSTEEYAALTVELADARATLARANRDAPGTGNDTLTAAQVSSRAASLRVSLDAALAAVPAPGEAGDPGPADGGATPTPVGPGAGGDAGSPSGSLAITGAGTAGTWLWGGLALLLAGAVALLGRRSARAA